MELTEFVRQRLDEQQDAWRGGLNLQTRPDFSRLSEQMLAQVAAMRAIVAMYERAAEYEAAEATRSAIWAAYREERTAFQRALGALAAIWSSHEAYDPAWAPDA